MRKVLIGLPIAAVLTLGGLTVSGAISGGPPVVGSAAADVVPSPAASVVPSTAEGAQTTPPPTATASSLPAPTTTTASTIPPTTAPCSYAYEWAQSDGIASVGVWTFDAACGAVTVTVFDQSGFASASGSPYVDAMTPSGDALTGASIEVDGTSFSFTTADVPVNTLEWGTA